MSIIIIIYLSLRQIQVIRLTKGKYMHEKYDVNIYSKKANSLMGLCAHVLNT